MGNWRSNYQVIQLTDNKLDPKGYWDQPISKILFMPTIEDVALFDQNGYDLTVIGSPIGQKNLHLAS